MGQLETPGNRVAMDFGILRLQARRRPETPSYLMR